MLSSTSRIVYPSHGIWYEGNISRSIPSSLVVALSETISILAEIDVVIKYIANQKEHHRKKTFQDEYRAFLKKYKVDYDERYVWD